MKKDTPACNCNLCQQIRRMRDIQAKLPTEDAEWLGHLMDAYLEESMDLDWHKAVAEGSWPDSLAILKRWTEAACLANCQTYPP